MCCIGLRVLVVERQGLRVQRTCPKIEVGVRKKKKRTQISVCSQWVSGSYLSILHFHTFLHRASCSRSNKTSSVVFFLRAREEAVEKYTRSLVPLSTCAYFSVRFLYSIKEPIQLKIISIVYWNVRNIKFILFFFFDDHWWYFQKTLAICKLYYKYYKINSTLKRNNIPHLHWRKCTILRNKRIKEEEKKKQQIKKEQSKKQQ